MAYEIHAQHVERHVLSACKVDALLAMMVDRSYQLSPRFVLFFQVNKQEISERRILVDE